MDGCHVHDPSAIAYVIQPSLFKTRRGPIRVVTDVTSGRDDYSESGST